MPRKPNVDANGGSFSCSFPYCTYSASNEQNLKRHKTAAGHHVDAHLANRARGIPHCNNTGSDLDTEAQTNLSDQAPVTDPQITDETKLDFGHAPEDVQPMAHEPAVG